MSINTDYYCMIGVYVSGETSNLFKFLEKRGITFTEEEMEDIEDGSLHEVVSNKLSLHDDVSLVDVDDYADFVIGIVLEDRYISREEFDEDGSMSVYSQTTKYFEKGKYLEEKANMEKLFPNDEIQHIEFVRNSDFF